MEPHQIKSKTNKLKIGQRVRALEPLVDWQSRHLVWCYARPADGLDGYSKGDKEIGISDLAKVYMWVEAKLSGKLPNGIVKSYGSEETYEEKGKSVRRKCVWVVFTFETGLGPLQYGLYVNEKNIKSIDRRKNYK